MCTDLKKYSNFMELYYLKLCNPPYFSCFIFTKVKSRKIILLSIPLLLVLLYQLYRKAAVLLTSCRHTEFPQDFATSYQEEIPVFLKAVKINLLFFFMQRIIYPLAVKRPRTFN